MIMHAEQFNDIVTAPAWYAQWVKRGMLCVQDLSRPKDRQSWELKGEAPARFDALGCGGWDEQGVLHWVGIDLDVGHGNEKQAYATRDEAIEAAFSIRAFVGGAAEIRLSKSGHGVHVRVSVAGVESDGRAKARLIALWLVEQLEIKSDRSVLGRQNLWFWAANTRPQSFELIEQVIGSWRPPPRALKEQTAPVAPPVPRAWHADHNGILKRAAAYMRRVSPAVSGSGGHVQAFKAACALVRGFALSIEDARPLLYTWNQTCQPPWAEKELEHKLRQALERGKSERGYLLVDNPETFKPRKDNEQTPELKASDLLKQQLADEVSGKRYAAEWPWPMLHRFTLALLPGNVCVFCAPPGSSKSFFMLQALGFWMHKGYRPAILELEENKTYHLRRALAQECDDSSVTDPEWVKANAEKADYYASRHTAYVDKLAACIDEAPEAFTTKTALEWMSARIAEKRRVIAIDPITARDPSERPWIDDQHFVRQAQALLRNVDTSLVLVTHPPKNPKDTSLDNVAGGAAYQRFSQVILWMEAIDPKEVNCTRFNGIEPCTINRKLHLRKTRNGRAANTCLGFHFNGKTLKFEECGIVPKE